MGIQFLYYPQSEESYIISYINNFYQFNGFNCTSYIDTASMDLTHEITIEELTGSNSYLTPQAIAIIDSMNSYFIQYTQNMDLNLFINHCNLIISQSLNLTLDYEKIICASGASVAKNSAIYWSDSTKILRFEALMTLDSLTSKSEYLDIPVLLMNEKEANILKADWRGAYNGAISGGIGGLVGGGLIQGSCRSFAKGLMEHFKIKLPWWASQWEPKIKTMEEKKL